MNTTTTNEEHSPHSNTANNVLPFDGLNVRHMIKTYPPYDKNLSAI